MPIDLTKLAQEFGTITVMVRGVALTVRTLSAGDEVAISRQIPECPILGRTPLEMETYRQSAPYRGEIALASARRMALRAGIAADLQGPAGFESWSPRWQAGDAAIVAYTDHVMNQLLDRELVELNRAAKEIPPINEPDGALIGGARDQGEGTRAGNSSSPPTLLPAG